jgi:hypothetical protein
MEGRNGRWDRLELKKNTIIICDDKKGTFNKMRQWRWTGSIETMYSEQYETDGEVCRVASLGKVRRRSFYTFCGDKHRR